MLITSFLFFIEDSIYKVENDILLYIVYKVIAIILILNEYYQLRMQHNFIGTNFIRKKHICFITKDMEV